METNMAEKIAWVCLILATALTLGIQGEMPCRDPTKYQLGLQVRVRKKYSLMWAYEYYRYVWNPG